MSQKFIIKSFFFIVSDASPLDRRAFSYRCTRLSLCVTCSCLHYITGQYLTKGVCIDFIFYEFYRTLYNFITSALARLLTVAYGNDII